MKKDRVVIYEPNQRLRMGWFETWKTMFRNINSSWELNWQLFRRDFFMAYRRSFLGTTWIFITPIIGIVSWVFYNMTGILSPGDTGIPYPAYVLMSTTIYGLWGSFQNAATGTLVAGNGFINQVNYPHEALLLKQVMIQMANFTLSFLMVLAVLLFFQVIPSWKIVLFPIVILPLFFLGTSIGLCISIISVVFPDLERVAVFLTGLVMYITPVIYSQDVSDPLLSSIIKYNPLTYLIGGARDCVIYGRIDNIGVFIGIGLFTFLMFLVSMRLFYVTEQRVVEKMI